MRRGRVRIDLSAIRHNVGVLQRAAPEADILAVVKADAYGHGLEGVLPALESVTSFGVAQVAEGVALRSLEADRDILVLQGASTPPEFDMVARKGLTPVLHSAAMVDKFFSAGFGSYPYWVKVDTGMGRLGLSPSDYERLGTQYDLCPKGLISHLACADIPEDPHNAKQIAAFRELAGRHQALASLANSAAVFAFPASHFDVVRPGLALYGVSPFESVSESELGLRSAMTFSAPLISIRHLKRGESVGYGRSWVCPEDMPVGVLGAGYADGYPRSLAGDADVYLGGERCPVIGRVSMDMITVDLRGISDVRVGEEAELWGQNILVSELARAAGTISYDLLCRAGNACAEKEYFSS